MIYVTHRIKYVTGCAIATCSVVLSFSVAASDAVWTLVHKGGHPLILLQQTTYSHTSVDDYFFSVLTLTLPVLVEISIAGIGI